jgi:hypothetical protein
MLAEVNGAVTVAKVSAPLFRVGELSVYVVGLDGNVVPALGVTEDQAAHPATSPFESVLISRTALPPAPYRKDLRFAGTFIA